MNIINKTGATGVGGNELDQVQSASIATNSMSNQAAAVFLQNNSLRKSM